MKYFLVLICLHLLQSYQTKGQSFVKEYDLPFSSGGDLRNIILTADSGYIVVSLNGTSQATQDRINIYKINQQGNIVWSTVIVTTNQEYFTVNNIISIDDSTYLTIGSMGSDTSASSKINLIKFDFFGNVIWNKLFADTINASEIIGCDIIKTNENELTLLASSVNQNGNIIIKVDTAANLISAKCFTNSNQSSSSSFVLASDSSLAVVDANNINIFLSRINKSGNVMWRKDIPHFFHLAGIESSDNGSVIISAMEGLIKIDSFGDTLWTKCFNTMGISNIKKTKHDFVASGIGSCSGEYFMMKFDSSGNITQSKQINSVGNNCAYFINQTPDMGYIMRSVFWVGMNPYTLVIKTDSLFDLPCASSTLLLNPWTSYQYHITNSTTTSTININLNSTNNTNWTILNTSHDINFCSGNSISTIMNYEPVIFPNPIHDHIQIKSDSDIKKYELYNFLGTKILEGMSVNSFSLASFDCGVYILKIYIDEKIYIKKIVKE